MRKSINAACAAIVIVAALVSAGQARAEWRKIGDAIFWSDVGVLSEFRVARVNDHGQYHTVVIDCHDRSYLAALTGAQGEEMVDTDWIDVEPHTIGETITSYACDLAFDLTGRWVGALDASTSPPTIFGFDQWSQVGELGDLRLTWIQRSRSHDRELWLARCSDAALLEASSIEGGKSFRISGHWKIARERADQAIVGYACGTCQSLLGFKCAAHDL